MNCALREEKSGDARDASTGWGPREKDELGRQARTAGREVPLWRLLCHADGNHGKAKVCRFAVLRKTSRAMECWHWVEHRRRDRVALKARVVFSFCETVFLSP